MTQNKAAFDLLQADRERIESEFGEPLIWTRRDDIRASRVYVKRPGAVDDVPEQRSEYRDWFVEHALTFKSVFASRLKSLELPAPGMATVEVEQDE